MGWIKVGELSSIKVLSATILFSYRRTVYLYIHILYTTKTGMNKLFTLLFTLLSVTLSAQPNPTEQAQPIVQEGKLLYRSEMASWYGTDLFLKTYKDRENIGGYFSYAEKDLAKCIFFSKGDAPQVIGEIIFDSTYHIQTATTNLTERIFTSHETDLYTIRKIAFAEIHSDTLFKTYKNSNLNLIPLISNNEKKVYVLTGPHKNGVVIFGNDYLLVFNQENQLLSKKTLHKNMIPINYEVNEPEDKQTVGAMHSHLPETGDFITATDICTLMLYEKFTKWKQHNVFSKKYLSIWNCLTDELVVVPMSTVEK